MTAMSSRSLVTILLLWLGITALDYNKAFHIDDTFHLKAAQWLEQHPGAPLGGQVNWIADPEPMHHFNQPPGFFYLVALTARFTGFHEGPLHLMRSLFTLLALLCMYRLALHRAPRHALLLTALFALCPAYMVNQGLMTDVPLLAMVLLFAVFLLVPGRLPAGWRHVLAGLALSAALLIKYSALPMWVVFILWMVLRREWRYIATALIPVAALAIWSAINLHEYGGVHLLDRDGGHSALADIVERNLAFVVALGAVAPFSPAFLGAFFRNPGRWIAPAWAVGLAVAAVAVLLTASGYLAEAPVNQVLRNLFFINGLLMLGYAVRFLPRSIGTATAETWTLAAWAFGMALFLVLFSPQMATRYLLPTLVPVLLLIAPALDRINRTAKALALASTGLLGVLLTISDKVYADFFRQQAPIVAREMHAATPGTVWSVGHWGWQWYAEQAGMAVYGTTTSPVAVGDIVVIPQDIDVQPLAPGLVLEPIAKWDEPPGPATFFNVEQFANMYTSSYGTGAMPWRLTRTHHKTIIAYRVARTG